MVGDFNAQTSSHQEQEFHLNNNGIDLLEDLKHNSYKNPTN
jgi:hypothetical protein